MTPLSLRHTLTHCESSRTHNVPFERGHTDEFRAAALRDLGGLAYLQLRCNGMEAGEGMYVKEVVVALLDKVAPPAPHKHTHAPPHAAHMAQWYASWYVGPLEVLGSIPARDGVFVI